MAGVPSYRGVSPAARVPGAGGGEGPWVWDASCGFVLLDGVDGDTWFVWSGGRAVVETGPGYLSEISGAGGIFAGTGASLYVLNFTGTGSVEIDAIDGGHIVAHRPAGSITTSTCA